MDGFRGIDGFFQGFDGQGIDNPVGICALPGKLDVQAIARHDHIDCLSEQGTGFHRHVLHHHPAVDLDRHFVVAIGFVSLLEGEPVIPVCYIDPENSGFSPHIEVPDIVGLTVASIP